MSRTPRTPPPPRNKNNSSPPSPREKIFLICAYIILDQGISNGHSKPYTGTTITRHSKPYTGPTLLYM